LVVNFDLFVIGRGSKLNLGLVQAVLDIHFLAIGGSSELDNGVAIVVPEHDIHFLAFHVVTGVDSDTCTIDIESLGCFKATYIESGSSRSRQVEDKISSLVIHVQFKLGTTALLGINFAMKGNSSTTSVGGCLTPNIAWKRGNVGGGANRGLRLGRSSSADKMLLEEVFKLSKEQVESEIVCLQQRLGKTIGAVQTSKHCHAPFVCATVFPNY
jgi:hypothetical protein